MECYAFLLSAEQEWNKKIARLRPAAIAMDNFNMLSDIHYIVLIMLNSLLSMEYLQNIVHRIIKKLSQLGAILQFLNTRGLD